ncbi:MAG: hypothetical protein IJT98_10080 [Prevotella sp.]|nr:hypothetical protein [Prevotella sp.]
MKRIVICCLFAASSTISVYSQNSLQSGTISPYSQYGMGVLGEQSQVAGRGMGGTGLALRGGTMVNTLNPASYSAIDSLTMLFDAGVTGQLTNFKENGNSVNARSAHFDYAVGLFRMMPYVGMSFGILPFSDVGYSYTSSTRLNSSVGSIVEQYTGKGGMHQAFIGIGWNPIKTLSIGVNASYLWGNYSRSVVTTGSTTVNSLSKTYKATVNTYNLTFGLQWQQPLGRHDNIVIGATLGLGHKMGADPQCEIVNLNTATVVSDTTTFTIDNGLELPLSYGVGLAWNHNQTITVAADITQQQWGSTDYPEYDENTKTYALRSGLLRNRTRMSLGVDYVPNSMSVRSYFKRIHYRLGTSYTTPYYNINGVKGPDEFSVSAGLGLPLQNAWNSRSVLNISAQWVRTSAKDFITDNSFRISLGLTFNERWFAKWRID